MTTVLKILWSICLLRSGPESLPTRAWFLCALIAAQLAVTTLLGRLLMPNVPVALTLNMVLINVAVLASVAWFVLYIRGFEARFPATLSAALGTRTLIDAVACVAFAVTSGLVQTIAMHALTLWGMLVVAFIMIRALACRAWIGMLISFAVVSLGLVITGMALGRALTASVALQ